MSFSRALSKRDLMPPRPTAMTIQPTAKAKVVTPDQKDQRDEGGQHGKINDLIPVHRKSAIIQGKRIKETVPSPGDRKEMHNHQAAIAEHTKHAHDGQNT